LAVHLLLLLSFSLVVLESSGKGTLDAVWAAMSNDRASSGGEGEGSAAADAESFEPFENSSEVGTSTDPDVLTDSIPLIEIPQSPGSALAIANLPELPVGPPTSKPGSVAAAGGTGSGREGEFGGGFEYTIPKTGRAVIKGNFAAWTVPEDPTPKEAYKIVIQIKLPSHVKRYALTDLSGLIEGTDQYKQTIPQNVRGFLPVVDHQTQLVVEVPGAEALVKDTITIRSRVLSESQTLEIVF
jgi:hypothetical protein